MKKWFAIFKTGAHTNSKGLTQDYTSEHLDKIVSNYKPSEYEAPIVVGHPKENGPAFGWIEAIKRVGNVLYAKPKQVVEEFAEAVKKGLYKNRSIALNPDMSLRHVGFLGAVPPAVKGLGEVEFNEENEALIEFEELEDAFSELYRENEAKIAELEERVAKFADLAEELIATKSAKEQAEEELNRLNLKMRTTEFQQFLNERIAFGNMLPAQTEKAMKVLEALAAIELTEKDDSKVFEFSDKTTADPVALFKEFLKNQPKVVEFKEVAKKEVEEKKLTPSEVIANQIRNNKG